MLKNFYELLRETFCAYIPTSKKKREEFLDVIREKVDYYKPKIEERCKINLGDVKVKDNREWINDISYGVNSIAWKHTLKDAWACQEKFQIERILYSIIPLQVWQKL